MNESKAARYQRYRRRAETAGVVSGAGAGATVVSGAGAGATVVGTVVTWLTAVDELVSAPDPATAT